MKLKYDSPDTIYVQNNLEISNFLKECKKIKGSSIKLCKEMNFTLGTYKNYLNMQSKKIPLVLFEMIKKVIDEEFNETDHLSEIMKNKIKNYKEHMFYFGDMINKHPKYKDIENDIYIRKFVRKIVTYCGGNFASYNEEQKRESKASKKTGINEGVLRYYMYPSNLKRNEKTGDNLKAYVDCIDLQTLIDFFCEYKENILMKFLNITKNMKMYTRKEMIKERNEKTKRPDIEVMRKRFYEGMYKTLSERYDVENWKSIHAQKAMIKRIKKTNYKKEITITTKSECIKAVKNSYEKNIPISPSILHKILVMIKDIHLFINNEINDETYKDLFGIIWRKVKSSIKIYEEKVLNILKIQPHLFVPIIIEKTNNTRRCMNYLSILYDYGESKLNFIRRKTDDDNETIYNLLLQLLNMKILSVKRNMSIWKINIENKSFIRKYWNEKLNSIVSNFGCINNNLFIYDKLLKELIKYKEHYK